MRKLLIWLLLIVVDDVSGFSLSELISDLHPLSISTSDPAQQFEGWGTSLAWFAEYVGGLAGDDMTRARFYRSLDHFPILRSVATCGRTL